LLNGIDIASEVIDLIAKGGDSRSAKQEVEQKCVECIESIQECQKVYMDACESQAGVNIPYKVGSSGS